MRRLIFRARFLGVIVAAALVGMWPMAASAATAPDLGSAADYAVLADGTGLTCTDSTVAGAVGVSSATTARATRRSLARLRASPSDQVSTVSTPLRR